MAEPERWCNTSAYAPFSISIFFLWKMKREGGKAREKGSNSRKERRNRTNERERSAMEKNHDGKHSREAGWGLSETKKGWAEGLSWGIGNRAYEHKTEENKTPVNFSILVYSSDEWSRWNSSSTRAESDLWLTLAPHFPASLILTAPLENLSRAMHKRSGFTWIAIDIYNVLIICVLDRWLYHGKILLVSHVREV